MLGQAFDTAAAPFAFLDLEMSGLEPIKHEIVEIAVVRVAQPSLEVLEEWSVKVQPQHLETADPESLKIIKYSDEAWHEAILLADAMKIFVEKTEGHIVAGWNVAYDWAFLEAAMQHTGTVSKIHKRILDVMSFAYGKLGDRAFDQFGLHKVASSLGITLEGHHEALADTKATFEVYRALVQKL